MDRIVNELLNQGSIEQLEDVATKISKEIEKRRKDIRLKSLRKFKQAFEEYSALDPEFPFLAVCDDCGCTFVINGEDALRTFFEERGV